MQLAATFIEQHVGDILIAGALLAAVWLNSRGKSGEALSYYATANETLVKQNHELIRDNKELDAENTYLRKATNFELALAPIVAGQVAAEANAEKRHVQAVVIWDLIAERMGRDPNHALPD